MFTIMDVALDPMSRFLLELDDTKVTAFFVMLLLIVAVVVTGLVLKKRRKANKHQQSQNLPFETPDDSCDN